MRVGAVLIIACAVSLKLPVSAQTDCTFHPVICEWKYRTFDWACENGKIPHAHAFWGREPGDRTTCSDGVPKIYLENDDCSGNSTKASLAVIQWCNNNVRKDGKCRIRASKGHLRINGEKYDPCPGTFKYLKVCRYCVAPAGKTCEQGGKCRQDHCQNGEQQHYGSYLCSYTEVCCIPGRTCEHGGVCKRQRECEPGELEYFQSSICSSEEVCCLFQDTGEPCEHGGICRLQCQSGEREYSDSTICFYQGFCCITQETGEPCEDDGKCQLQCYTWSGEQEYQGGTSMCYDAEVCCVRGEPCQGKFAVCRADCTSDEHPHHWNYCPHPSICCIDNLYHDLGEPCAQDGRSGVCERQCMHGEQILTMSDCFEGLVCCAYN